MRLVRANFLPSIAARPLLKNARHELIRWAVRLGVPRFRQALTGRRHVILTFHRIRPAGSPLDPFDTCPSLPVDVFGQILEYVNHHFDGVSLRDLAQRGPTRVPAAAITFDDGWRDNYELAFPVLRELAMPATVFVTTGRIGSSQPFWQQTLGQLIRGAINSPNGQAEHRLKEALDVAHDLPLTPTLYRRTVARWKTLEHSARQERLFRAGWAAPDESEALRLFLSESEMREMAVARIDFGSHTVNHSILPHHSAGHMASELKESKSTLETILGAEVDMLAYPNGDHSDEVVDQARSADYRIGCTTRNMRVSVDDDRLLLPRVEPEWDVEGHTVAFDADVFQWRAK